LTDRGLAPLTTLEHLWLLDLSGTPLSDEGLAHVGRVNGLQLLTLASCGNLTSGGLAHLTRLPILRRLSLWGTPIDDGAVKHLKQMTCLRILYLNGTKVTASGIEELRRALPKCVIFWDGGAVIPGAAAPAPAAPAKTSEAIGSPPPPAIAPFDATKAKQHQEAWAKHLGVPGVETNSIGMKLVLIPPGEFEMGSSESAEELAKAFANWDVKPDCFKREFPGHRVRITKPFYLGACEVTVGQFRKFVEDCGYKTDAEKDGKGGSGIIPSINRGVRKPEFTWRNTGFEQTDGHPVVNVSWNDAVAFCEWLSRKEGKTYRLPTEAEWEYACRAGSTTAYCFGDDAKRLDDYAWYSAKLGLKTHPVGEKKANAWGLYDTHGNVFEWCGDWFDENYYAGPPPVDPTGPTTGRSRVYRGGGLNSTAGGCRSANRYGDSPGTRSYDLGFRASLIPPDK
jgi:formylglycine-generating enzyme required for sulfatase activity